MSKTTVDKTMETEFTKAQLVNSKQFSTIHKDVMNALLEEDTLYSIQQTKQLIKDFEDREAR